MRITISKLTLGMFVLLSLSTRLAMAQLAPTGGHYAARSSDTGFAALVNSTGGFTQSVPLELAPARNGLPVPLEIIYGGRRLGAAGMGWDLPLSYIQRDLSYSHRLPKVNADGLPIGEERLTLVLAGRSMLLMRKGDQSSSTVWVPMRDAPQIEVHDEGNGVMHMYDGDGRTYTFINNGPAGPVGQSPTEGHHLYAGGTLYLLQGIATAGNSMKLEYVTTLPQLSGGITGLAIHLHDIYYNISSATPGCYHDRIIISYTDPSPTPLSISMVNHETLVRHSVIKWIDVHAYDSCTPASNLVLRRHAFTYDTDPDTTQLRLTSVLLYGREGTREFTHPISLGSYSYGTVSTGGSLSYTPAGTAFMPSDRIAATLGKSEPISSGGHSVLALTEMLTDLTGDGIPDLFYARGNGYVIAPGSNDSLGFTGAGSQDSDVFSRPSGDEDARTSVRPLETRSLSAPRYRFDASGIFGSIVEDEWRRAIDFNGDGRIDIIDAHETPGQWVVHLNTPGPSENPIDIRWRTVRFPIDTLFQKLNRSLDDLPRDYLPISRRHTGRNISIATCFKYSSIGQQWVEFPVGMSNGQCSTKGPDDPSNIREAAELTFVEWDLKDLNGDGYPDFVLNTKGTTDETVEIPDASNQPAQPADGAVVKGVRSQNVRYDGFLISAEYNVAGPHLAHDPAGGPGSIAYPFAPAMVDIWAALPSSPGEGTCGLELWITPLGNVEGHRSNQDCGFLDVNGDGLLDRVENGVAWLQGGNEFNRGAIQLPSSEMASHGNNHDVCISMGTSVPSSSSSQATSAYRDMNGDGIPDYIFSDIRNASFHVQFGTGAGFVVQSMPIAVPFGLSAEDESCISVLSQTVGGLVDVNGDGKPDLVTKTDGGYVVHELGGGILGRPEAGLLVSVDNGEGALINISYGSAKRGDVAQQYQVPFPEIVATRVQIVNKNTQDELTADTFYAFGKPLFLLDAVTDEWTFAGYGRYVQLQATNGIEGVATVSDTYSLTIAGALPGTKESRFIDNLRVGRPKDVSVLSGLMNCIQVGVLGVICDPWGLLSIDVSADARQIKHTNYDYSGKLFQEPSSDPSMMFCWEMVFPYDDDLSESLSLSASFQPCLVHGFLFTKTIDILRDNPSTDRSNGVRTHFETGSVDDNGNILSSFSTGDGDVSTEVDTTYAVPSAAAPPNGGPRVLSAVATRDVFAYPRPSSGGHYASESWSYDNLPPGSVGNGRPTSHVTTRLPDSGDDSQSLGTVQLALEYDAASGALTRATSARQDQNGAADGALRTITFSDYDIFKLVARTTRVDAISGRGAPAIPALVTTTDWDPVTLKVRSTTDPNGTVQSHTYDGFDREILTTLTSPPSSSGFHGTGAVSATIYAGFGIDETGGRSISQTSFIDPVDPATALAAAATGAPTGHTSTVYLDELGRVLRKEIQLGADYGGQRLVVGDPIYDKLGRVFQEFDPYSTAQGRTYQTIRFFNTDGSPLCFVRSRAGNPPSLTNVTDEENEVYPTCFSHNFANHLEFTTVQRPDALLRTAPDPQAGVTTVSALSASGKLRNQVTRQNSTLLDNMDYGYDALGHLNLMRRYGDPVALANPVTTQWKTDSAGNVIELDELDGQNSAPRTRVYDSWGEMTDETWTDTTSSSPVRHHAINRYDGLGRLLHSEEQRDGNVDPETVADYQYDSTINVSDAVTWSASNALGRMTQATWGTGAVAFSYDSLGRVSSRLFTDEQLNVYVQHDLYHGDGSMSAIDLLLPDNIEAPPANGSAATRRDEHIAYGYDSAGRMRSVGYSDGITSQDLFEATNIDVLGRVRAAQYGNTSYAANYAETGRRLINDWSISSVVAGQTHTRSISFPRTEVDNLRAFDPVGRERGRVEITDGSSATTTRHANAYDPLGRLQTTLRVTGGDVQQRGFGYDPLGNVFRLGNFDQPQEPSNAFLTYGSNDRDRVTQVRYGDGPNVNVSYDGVGNIVRMGTSTGSTRRLDYLASGLVRQISDDAGNSAHFRYDAFGGLQLLDLDSGSAAKTRHDRYVGDLISVRDELVQGTVQKIISRTVPGPNGFIATRHGVTAAQGATSPPEWIFGFGEGRGNRYFTDERGRFVQNITYEPFGAVASNTDTNGNEFADLRLREYSHAQWNGGDALEALGVTMLGARVYDPVIGRFLSRDPLLIPRTAATTNPYAFAMNDPVNLSDPSGLDPLGCGLLCIGSVGDIPGLGGLAFGAVMLGYDIYHLLDGDEGRSTNRAQTGMAANVPPPSNLSSANELLRTSQATPARATPPQYSGGCSGGYPAAACDYSKYGVPTPVITMDDVKDVIANSITESVAKTSNGIADAGGMTVHPSYAFTAADLRPGIRSAVSLSVDLELAIALGMIGPAAEATEEGLVAYEVDTYNALKARSIAGDGLDIHHVGQAHAFEQTIPGYSRATGPAIAIPKVEHLTIPTLRGAVSLTPRQILARDIWYLRRLGTVPNSSLLRLIELNMNLYPEALAP